MVLAETLPSLGTALIGAAAANLVFGTILVFVMRGKLDPPRVNDGLRRMAEEFERLWRSELEENERLRKVIEEERGRADNMRRELAKATLRWQHKLARRREQGEGHNQ